MLVGRGVRAGTGEVHPLCGEPHPLSRRYRAFTDSEFAGLVDDVGAHGVRVPVVLFEGKILDGVHRAAAAAELGVHCPTVELPDGVNPEAFVHSMNGRRRHLQTGELALAAASSVTTERSGGGDQGVSGVQRRTVPEAAGWAGLGTTTVSEARTVLEDGDADLVDAVRSGDVSVKEAASRARVASRARSAGIDRIARQVLRGDLSLRRGSQLVAKLENAEVSRDVEVKPHPAVYTLGVVPTFAALLRRGPLRVLDPFAGHGHIHKLRDLGDYSTAAVEMQEGWAAAHPDTLCGDSRSLPFDDDEFDAVATSPAYGNRLADYGLSGPPADAALRRSYACSYGEPLLEGNAAALPFGPEYKEIHIAVWDEVVRVVRPGGVVLLNVKDFWCDGEHVGVSGWHLTHFTQRLGAEINATVSIESSGWTEADNGEWHLAGEWVFRLQLP